MDSFRECSDYIKSLREQYIKQHITITDYDHLLKENHIENRDIKGYHGREIFELIQNADDAYQKSIDNNCKPSDDLRVKIVFRDGFLTISNTGTCFDKEGVKAIIEGNNSDKPNGYIGNKGTGFRSVLNWSDEIYIKSGYYNLKFSKSYANEIFESIKDEPQIVKQIDKANKLGLKLEILFYVSQKF